jgi:hypothetical protein
VRTLAQLLPSAEMGTAQQEIPVAAETLQHEGLLNEDTIYVIMRDDYGHTTVEGCYVSERKARLRLAVLHAERELVLAKAREEYPEDILDHNDFGSTCHWLVAEKLIR